MTNDFTKTYEQAVAQTQAHFAKFMPQASKSFEDLAAQGKANMEALVKAGELAQAGAKTLGDELTSLNKAAVEANVANVKALMAVKDVQEAIELQSGQVREGFDKWLAESNKVAELSLKIATDVAEPIQARANVAAEEVQVAVKNVAA